jgi:hypothetical protein
MPRLPPERYPGTPLYIDRQPFKRGRVNRILAIVGEAFPLLIKKKKFQERLNSIAQLHSFVVSSNTEPTLTAEQSYLVDLRWAARRLAALVPLDAVSDDDEGRFPHEPSHGVLRLLDAPMAELIERRLSDERGAWVKRQRRSDIPPTARRPSPPSLSASDIYGGDTPTDILTVASEVAHLLEQATTHALEQKRNRQDSLGRPAVYGELALPLMELYIGAFGQKPGVSRSDDNAEVTGPMVRFIKTACSVMGLEISGEAIAKEKAKHYSKKRAG